MNEISEKVIRVYRSAQIHDVLGMPAMFILADALRTTLARAIKAEAHILYHCALCAEKYMCEDCERKRDDWQAAAHAVLMGEEGEGKPCE